jgi:hypothetical protein
VQIFRVIPQSSKHERLTGSLNAADVSRKFCKSMSAAIYRFPSAFLIFHMLKAPILF